MLRYWMDNRKVGKTELFRYNTQLREEFDFVKALNSHACQTAVERVLRAINRFYDNCKKQIKGKKGYPKFSKTTRSVEFDTLFPRRKEILASTGETRRHGTES